MKTRACQKDLLLIDFSSHNWLSFLTGPVQTRVTEAQAGPWHPVFSVRNLSDLILLSVLFGEIRKAVPVVPAYLPVCVWLCQLLRQSLAPSPSLDWHLCPPQGHARQPHESHVFWRRVILNECNNRNSHHFIQLQSHPGLDITPPILYLATGIYTPPRMSYFPQGSSGLWTAAACPAP